MATGGGHNHAHPSNTYAALLVVVCESCTQVALIAVLGFILARQGVITGTVRKSLNKLNNNVFTPCLLASKIAFSLTPSKLAELWVVPLGFVIITIVSILSAWLLAKLFRLKRSHTAFAVACASCPNANSLPVALMQSLVYSVDKQLRWDKDDTKETMLGRALSYLVLFSTLGTIYRWSLAVKLFSISDEQPIKLLDEPDEEQRAVLNSPPAQDTDLQQDPFKAQQPAEDEEAELDTPQRPRGKRQRTHVYSSFPNTPAWMTPATTPRQSRAGDSNGSDESASEDDSSDLGQPASTRRQQSFKMLNFAKRHIYHPLRRAAKVTKEFLTPPLWSVLLSILICFIPPVQRTLDVMVPLKEALKSAGNSSIPITLIVLGSFMHQEEEEQPSTLATRNGRPPLHSRTSLRKSTMPAKAGETKTVLVTVLARMVFTPLIVLPLLYWMSLAKNGVGDDPVFVISAALLIGSPPALTLAQITDAAAPGFERLISKLMLWSYAIMTAPTTILLVLAGLWFDQLDSHSH